MKNLIYFLLVLFLLKNTFAEAHPGGHYHRKDGIILDTWKLKSGDSVKGNFSFFKDDKIYLEEFDGMIVSVPIEDLSSLDQKIAIQKINKYVKLNDPNFEIDTPDTINPLKYVPVITLIFLIFLLYVLSRDFLFTYVLNNKLGLSTISFLFILSIFIACSKSDNTSSANNVVSNPVTTPVTTPVTVSIPKTNITFMDSAFAAFKPALSTSWDNTYYYISSTGIPNHNMMIGITSWQQQVPISQPYTGTNSWSIPLQPAYAAVPLSTKTNLMKGAVAVAVNGIPIFNALNNRGEDSYKIGELDNWGGHCGRGDDYHYHAAPMHLSSINGLKPIAFAVDGFPVYGTKEPDGATMIALDTCHGHVGVNGIYHYHGTSDYPYVVGALKGKVTLDPATTAPENQVIPQAFTKPVRPATTPLNGAVITDFTSVGTNGYLLTYKIGSKNGYVKYSWDATNTYTFILTDTAGKVVTNTYKR